MPAAENFAKNLRKLHIGDFNVIKAQTVWAAKVASYFQNATLIVYSN